jgi:ubiquinone/menaquinone biosynthesis C-methylase UbiE
MLVGTGAALGCASGGAKSSPPPAGSGAKAEGAEASVNPGINDRYKSPEGRNKAVALFEEPERGAYQKPDEVVKALGLKGGETVADVGAGSGYLEQFLAEAVGSSGHVYAEDVQPEFLELVKEKSAKSGWKNDDIVLGSDTDAKLPEGSCDVVVVLDAYHHFEKPRAMIESLRRALKPDGRLVIVEFYRKTNDIFEKLKLDYMKHIRLDMDDAIKEISSFGLRHLETKQFLKWQYFAVFAPEPLAEAEKSAAGAVQ